MMELFFDTGKTGKFVRFGKNMIKGPVTWAAEIVKDYPEHGKKMLMSYEAIQNAVKNQKQFTVTRNHVPMTDGKSDKLLPISKDVNLGTIKEIYANDDCRCGRGIAYLKVNMLEDFVVNMLLRGGTIGISGGGFARKLGPGGHYKGENYDILQEDVVFHHMAMVLQGIPKCPPNVCGFNLGDAFADSVDGLDSYVKSKIPVIISKGEVKNQAQAVAIAISHCKRKLGLKENFEFSTELPPDDFKDFYEFLVSEELIVEEPCVRDFYIEFKEAWTDLDKNGFKYDLEQINDKNNLSQKSDKNLSVEDLKKIIENLQAENEKLRTTQIADLSDKNKDLEKKVQDAASVIESLKQEIVKKTQFENQIKDSEMSYIRDALTKTGKYTPDEISALDYEGLKREFETAKRFVSELQDANLITVQPQYPQQMVLAPQQMAYPQGQYYPQNAPMMGNGYAVMPMPPQKRYFAAPPPPAMMPQAQQPHRVMESQNPAAPQPQIVQYPNVPPGSVPTPDELFDDDNPRWKDNQKKDDRGYI